MDVQEPGGSTTVCGGSCFQRSELGPRTRPPARPRAQGTGRPRAARPFSQPVPRGGGAKAPAALLVPMDLITDTEVTCSAGVAAPIPTSPLRAKENGRNHVWGPGRAKRPEDATKITATTTTTLGAKTACFENTDLCIIPSTQCCHELTYQVPGLVLKEK